MSLPDDLRRRLKEILSEPTAPFAEGRVHARLRAAVRASPRLRERLDDFGNLEVVYGRGRPALYFACHTDHPALRANGDGSATIVGGIRAAALVGARLRPLSGEAPRPVVSRVLRERPPARVRLRGARGLRAGTPLVLDLEGVRLTKRCVRGVAIDDLCAVAACLTAMDRLEAARWRGCVGFLFTRAEEVGFAGALAWSRARRLPRSTAIVNLEMSKELRHTPQGGGPILRVGDRMSVFDPALTASLEAVARRIAHKDPSFRYQRALMDGGACEATAFAQAGYRAGALCLPLRNYHNHAARGGMGHEYVASADAAGLVRWIVAFARAFGTLRPAAQLQARLDTLWRKNRRALEASAAQGKGS